MCGRYAASKEADRLSEIFETVAMVPGADLPPRFNIAPTDPVAAVLTRTDRESGQDIRKLAPLRWGLVPSWSKDPKGGARMINARSETVADKPAFRKAFANRRCLLPADGYYEWYQLAAAPGSSKPRKQPFFISPTAANPARVPGLMAMAGLYEFWRDDTLPADHPDAWWSTCTIITTQATDALGHIHDRMPVQVRRDDWADWLDPRMTDPLGAHDLMHFPAEQEMTAWAVSTAVGKVGNEGRQLILPLDGEAV